MDKAARKRTLAMHHMPFLTWKFIHIIRVIAAVTQTSCPKRRKLCYTSVPVKVAQYFTYRSPNTFSDWVMVKNCCKL